VARFLLVHGAWHGGWCFAEVARELTRRGHLVETPDLPCEELGLTQHDYARLVGPQPDAVVLGHSLGGQTVALVEARVRVYLGAILPVETVYADSFAEGFGGFVRDGLGRSYWPDEEACAAGMYPDCTREQSDRAFAQLRRQAPFDAIAKPFEADDVVFVTGRDAAVDPDWQRRTALAHGLKVVELDTGHSPFFTHPVELADALESVA